MNNRIHVLQAFMEKPWAILPNKLAIIEEIVMRHVSGEKLSAEEIQARVNGGAPAEQRQIRSVAILPLFGVIFPRANMVENISGPGGTSAERFGQSFSKLLNDPAVDAIVIDINSPGGQVGGIQEVSQKIFNARGTKPIIAVANPMTASGAYWIGTAADELVVTPSGDVGSVGVYAVHEDISAFLEKEGVRISIISAGKYKVEANQYQPLTEEARSAIQSDVDNIYEVFVNDVARNRGVNPDVVRNGFGEGRVVMAEQAVKMGMADRIATLEDVVNELLNNKNGSPAGVKASVADDLKLSGQVPASMNIHTQEARARLASVGNITLEGDNEMNQYLRGLVSQREALVARATELVENADKENRDMTDKERAEFNEIMGVGEEGGKVAALDAQIEQIQGEREKLRVAAEKKFTDSKAEKPSDSAAGGKVMKRADYNRLSPEDRLAFSKANGKLTD